MIKPVDYSAVIAPLKEEQDHKGSLIHMGRIVAIGDSPSRNKGHEVGAIVLYSKRDCLYFRNENETTPLVLIDTRDILARA